MPSRFVITDHALSRFGELSSLPGTAEDLEQALLAELERGVAYGAQLGNDVLYLLPCGDVAAVVWDHGIGVVKTILSREHAIANMESMGVTFRGSHKWTPEPDVAELRELAEQHFNSGETRKKRNACI
jgi:hypothetical protein